MGVHSEKLPAYGTLNDAIYGLQLIMAHVRNGLVDGMPVDLACALHGGHTALGVGLSFYPHSTLSGTVGDAELATLDEEEIVNRIESALPAQGSGTSDAQAFPWLMLIPLVIQLIKLLSGK